MNRSTTGRLGDLEMAVSVQGEQLEQLFGKLEWQSSYLSNISTNLDRMNLAVGPERIARIEQTLNQVVIDLRILRQAIGVAFAGRANGHTWREAREHYGRAAEMLGLETGETENGGN